MPKDELDPEDPMELHGVALFTEEDTSDSMTECFVEEFLRLGFSADRVLALFRNPHYTGPNMVLQNRGETHVRDKIAEVFGWWGRKVAPDSLQAPAGGIPRPDTGPPPRTSEYEPALAGPGGAAIPGIHT